MSAIKYMNRIRRIDSLIKRKATGTPKELSMRLGMSESSVKKTIKEMKELGAPITFCQFSRSYIYYEQSKSLVIGYVDLSINELKSIQAGNRYFSKFNTKVNILPSDQSSCLYFRYLSNAS